VNAWTNVCGFVSTCEPQDAWVLLCAENVRHPRVVGASVGMTGGAGAGAQVLGKGVVIRLICLCS